MKTESQCGVANEGGASVCIRGETFAHLWCGSGETDSGDTTGTADKGGAKGKNIGESDATWRDLVPPLPPWKEIA